MTGEMFDGEFDTWKETNEFNLDQENDGYLPDEYEPWFTDMCEELDSELLNEDFLIE